MFSIRRLPVVTVGVRGGGIPPTLVRTKQKIPLFCGPTPLEVLTMVCVAFGSDRPVECTTTAAMCSVIANATRLPECRDGATVLAEGAADGANLDATARRAVQINR
jgi:hypothetical protein